MGEGYFVSFEGRDTALATTIAEILSDAGQTVQSRRILDRRT